MKKLTAWCMEKESVDRAREQDPSIGLISCRGPDCPRYDGGRCILLCWMGKTGMVFPY